MIVGRIAVGIIILAIIIDIFVPFEKVDELLDNVGALVCIAAMLLMAYCVISEVYLLIKAGVV